MAFITHIKGCTRKVTLINEAAWDGPVCRYAGCFWLLGVATRPWSYHTNLIPCRKLLYYNVGYTNVMTLP